MKKALPQKTRNKHPVGKKKCTECKREKSLAQFYLTSNPIASSDGKTVDICKNCIKKGSFDDDGSINVEKFKQKLMLIDKPFVTTALDSAIQEVKKALELGKGRTDIIGCYFKNLNSLPQYSKIGFLESLTLDQISDKPVSSVTTTEKKTKHSKDIYVKQIDDFVVTDEMLDLFGEGYTKDQYCKMTKKFDKLKLNYSMQTNMHEEALVTYVRFKIQEEEATATGDVASADKWNKAAQDAADKAKITPKQLTQADLQGGITSVSEISKACEQAVEIVEMLPRYIYQPNDALDFNIYCYINYARKLRGLPQCEYKDIYQFYDKKKQEYLDQYGDPYGIFEGDTTEKNRPNVEKFITLPKDYNGNDDG